MRCILLYISEWIGNENSESRQVDITVENELWKDKKEKCKDFYGY